LATEATIQETTVTDMSATSRTGKSDSPECQTGPSSFPEDNKSSWSPDEQGVPKDGSCADEPGISQGRTGPRSETLADNEAKPDMEKIPKEVAAK
jgi:hypothetical protein